MTLTELIDELLSLRDDEGVPGDTEVRVAYQPNYPLSAECDTVTFVAKTDDASEGGQLFLAETGRNDYAPRCAWEGGIVYPDDDDAEAA